MFSTQAVNLDKIKQMSQNIIPVHLFIEENDPKLYK